MLKTATALAFAAAFVGSPALAASAPSPDIAEAATEGAAEVSSARLAAVLVYADWCGSCLELDPKVKAVEASGVDGVSFFTLDYTDRDKDAFYAAAAAAGVEEPVRAFLGNKVKTGQLLMIDLDDGTVVGKLTRSASEDEISGALSAAASVA